MALALGTWMPVSAQPTIPGRPVVTSAIAVELTQNRVVKNEKGEEQLVDAAAVKPGDVIEYRATYTNRSTKNVTALIGDLPIPEGLEYIPRSARPGAALVKAAADDGIFSSEPLMRALPDGKKEPRPYSDYRALRWTLGQLPAGGVTTVSARARVEIVVPKVPVASSPGTTTQAPGVAKQ